MTIEKFALIMAGGSGMGAAAARKLAQDGYQVATLSSSGKGEALAKELGGVGVTGSNLVDADVQRLVDLVMEKWNRIDALVNSAGHGPRAPILELTDEDWHHKVFALIMSYLVGSIAYLRSMSAVGIFRWVVTVRLRKLLQRSPFYYQRRLDILRAKAYVLMAV